MNFLWILLIVVVAVEATVLPETVTTVYGKIKGVTETLPSGNQVQFFKGIPFAKPPVGTLRFEKPQPPEPWTTTLNATSFGKQCVQFFLPPFNGATDSEDCLFINIARPTTPSIDPRGYPVMLYLFGGAFVTGSALSGHNAYANDALVTKGVILASINYRLGPLGYYSSRDLSAPGNYALWDIIQALQFIQDVIPQFGGDKNLLAGCDQVANKKECLKALSIEQLVNISAVSFRGGTLGGTAR
uniref:Carboxylesterase type B domain-containing protein n=1 Tax=Panagrolaimus sp. JU765 TaxID=591449 RepID=A0AC34RQR1_9BILA